MKLSLGGGAAIATQAANCKPRSLETSRSGSGGGAATAFLCHEDKTTTASLPGRNRS
ncbi:hypothetical protein [Chroococcidiopsis sp. CCMEE 29]|uniref:hypothetical protein n=1 Tax=Chroococcidiopsis sp. CCMEE 29 TaxID=155894 RepID=UPI0020212104|nr:hypothetical protein [Chroococcidiopsis sp. CCMEE 29]